MMLGNSNKNLLGLRDNKKKYISNDDISFEFESSHSEIVKLVKENTKVLDLGCSDGIIGKYLKKHKNCVVYGCDINESSLNIVKESRCYEEVFYADLDSDKVLNKTLDFNSFDYIIISDVLEHLKNPENIIRRAKEEPI